MEENTIFRKWFLLVVCAIISMCELAFCQNNVIQRNAKIIIVGCGPSGIAAATKLMENGFNNITILEAEDRIGGRVYTTKFGNYSIDLGGQWIHGTEGNTAFELAHAYGLIDVSDKEDSGLDGVLLDSSGNYIKPEIGNKLLKFYEDHIDNIDLRQDPTSESLGEHAEKTFNDVFKNDSSIQYEKRNILEHLELNRNQEDAAFSWRDVSVSTLTEYTELHGDQWVNWKERGYSTILDILMKRYPNPEYEHPVLNNTILNTEVSSIDYLQNVDGPSVLVTAASGQLYKADHVIVTVSVGVLKEAYKSLFIPPLPDNKVIAIKATGFGAIGKIFLMYDKPFWTLNNNTRILYFSLIWNEAERKQIEADPEKEWLLGVATILTVESKPNLLSLWISGKYVKQMEELPEEKVFNHSVENIQRFLGKNYNVTLPVAMLRSRWYKNPHFRGTYSYRSVEAHKQKVFPKTLERPLNEQKLKVLFAGEATSSHRYGTVDGAIRSGWKAAGRLIEHYKKLNESTASAA